MKLLLAMLPTVLLTSYSQLIIKWRVASHAATTAQTNGHVSRTFAYLLDPFIISAYTCTLLSAIAWLFLVVQKHPISIAFPAYVGVLFLVVTLGSTLWLKETISFQHVVGLALIIVGVVVVSRATS